MMLVIAGVAVASIAWFALSGRGSNTTGALLSTTKASAAQDSIGRDFLELLQELRSVRIDTQVFSDPAFASLRDFSSPIISEPVGRENPFAPIDAAAATAQ